MKKVCMIIMIFIINLSAFCNTAQFTETDVPFHGIKAVAETLSEESIKRYNQNSISVTEFVSMLVTLIGIFSVFIVIFILIQRKEMRKKNEMIQLIDNKNKQIQNIIDNVPAMVSIKTGRGKYLFTNEKNARFFGVRASGMKNRYMNEFYHIDKENFLSLEKMDRRVIETGEDVVKEILINDYWGKPHTLKITKTLFMYDEDENSRVVLTSASDVSELKAKNFEIQSSYEQIKAISDELAASYKANEALIEKIEKLASISFFQFHDKDVLLKNFFNRLNEFIPEFEKGVLVTRKDDKAVFLDSKGYDNELLNRFEFHDEFFLDVEKPEIFDNILNLTEKCSRSFRRDAVDQVFGNVRKSLLIPIRSEKMHYGNISVDIEDENKEFSIESRRFAAFFSNLIGLYLQIDENKSLLNESYMNFSTRLAYIAEAYDEVTGNHIDRVGELSYYIALKMGLSPNKVHEIKNFAPLHDIGKILVPKSILTKKEKLSDEEWSKMKKHTLYGKKLLGDDDYFKTALNIALYHHERYDGSGYPYGIKGEDIPIEAAIVSIVDVYDALRSERPYKGAYSHEKSLSILKGQEKRTQPSHFNPVVFNCFFENNVEISELWDRISNTNKKKQFV